MKEMDRSGTLVLSAFRDLRMTKSREVVKEGMIRCKTLYTSGAPLGGRLYDYFPLADFFRCKQHAMLEELKTKTG